MSVEHDSEQPNPSEYDSEQPVVEVEEYVEEEKVEEPTTSDTYETVCGSGSTSYATSLDGAASTECVNV